jgi:LuxR family maltose regulon positive regulatory protein
MVRGSGAPIAKGLQTSRAQPETAPIAWTDLEPRAPGFRPLGSRLRPPGSAVPVVKRDALVTSLLGCHCPLVVVIAPAGYGKTIGLTQWFAADPRPGAWLQLDEADNDPVVLLSYLSLALGRVAPLDPSVLDSLARRTPRIYDQILPMLGAALGEAPPFLLLLDDGHLLQNETCWKLLATLTNELPVGAQVCVASRTDPPLPLGRLRAAGRLAEYGLSDVAFDRRETDTLLRMHGRDLEAAALDRLQETTEGWPAGLCLSLLADARAGGVLDRDIRGDQRAIASFLTEEVLERQPEEVRNFLLRTSILDSLSADVCRAVTGDDGAGEHLTRVAHDSLFVAALDDHGEWYRYHHLFADLLRTLETRRAPGEIPTLHRRAAEWYRAHGAPERAVRHWLAAGDVEDAADPAFESCFTLVESGQTESARRMLDLFSDAELSEHFALTMAAAWLYGTVIGDPVKGERWRRTACTAPAPDGPAPGGRGTWRGYQAAIRALLAPDGVSRMLVDAELVLACEQVDAASESDAEGSACVSGSVPNSAWSAVRILGVADYLNGRPRRAEGRFREALEGADPLYASYCLAFLSLVASDEARYDDAVDLDGQALALSPEMGLDISPGMYVALPQLLAHVRVLAQRNDPETDAFIAKTERYLGDMVPQVAWRVLLVATVLGEVLLAGHRAEAERWCRRAETVLAKNPDSGMLRGRVKRLREALEERRMADPLTAAERRVLDLLPTQLTAGQMATRLFLTENTVKSHLSHIYRKLGVTTRTDAVETARRLGLL